MSLISDLQAENIISAEEANDIESQVAAGEIGYEKALLNAGVDPEKVATTLAGYYGIPVQHFGEHDEIEKKLLSYIPEESARHYGIIPLRVSDGVLIIGINDPEDLQTRDVLNFLSSKNSLPYKLVYMLTADLNRALQAYENLTGEVDEALTSLEHELDDKVTEEKKQKAEEALGHIKEDAPVTKIVATILRYAVDGKASDIHIEPTPTKVKVRFRVDGQLQTSLELPQKVQYAIVARVKILSSMRLDERRRPQDGRFSANFDNRRIDFRVSILPTNHGEKVVMRILDNERGIRTLEDVGMSPHLLKAVRRAVNQPYGIILISGPTGAGKSTTLYAMLAEVDRLTKNVLSLEDPVEYDIDGVSQSQVRPEIGYTFATGLRSALRQDPDVILVGEIRDKETAQLAIQAALTGHLVLSTIHTNSAIGVVPRLVDMGIDPYLIAPTLKLAMAQRLVRRLCDDTGEPEKVEGGLKTILTREFEDLPAVYRDRVPEMDTVMHPAASPECAAGTKGRIAIMEALEVDSEIENLILHNGSEEDMYNAARKNGFMTMKEDAIVKALEHKIPIEEVSMFGTETEDDVLFDESNPVPPEPVDNQPKQISPDAV